jgi:glycosyltransferase involved in cell wall biosynthesis
MGYLLPPGTPGVRYVDSLQRPIAPADDFRALRTILSTLTEVQPDIVHTHMAKAGLLGRLAAAIYNRTAGRRRRARVIHTYHGHVLEGYFQPLVAAAFVRIERALARGTDRLVAISPRIRDELVDRFAIAPADRFAVVPLGFDLSALEALDDPAREAARAALDIPPGALVVTTVGRLTAIKNHALFLEGARRIAQRSPHALFLVAGGGELQGDLERQAAALGIAGRVRFLGWRRDLATIYGATDVFALTSRNEGTPVALIEAMAAGVPGVSTDVGGVPDVVRDPSLGRLVAPDDPEALAAAVLDLSSSGERRRQIGQQARVSVVGRYDLRRLVTDIDALYRSVLHDAN